MPYYDLKSKVNKKETMPLKLNKNTSIKDYISVTNKQTSKPRSTENKNSKELEKNSQHA